MLGFDLFKQTTYLHACHLVEEGRYGEALPLLHKLIADGETGEDLLVTALSCALHLENWELAAAYAQRIIEFGYEGPDALFWLTDYFFGCGDNDKGQQALAALLTAEQDDTALLWDTADMLRDYGMEELYWQVLRQITAVSTKDAYQLLDQADAYLSLENKEEAAERAYTAARRLPDGNSDDFYYAASILEQCGKTGKALELYKDGIERFPADADFILGVVRCLASQGEFAAAETELNRARQQNPDLPGLDAAAKAVAREKRKLVDFQSYRKRKTSSAE
ncbi:MAG: tetratricopeptide repeat protein [Sporomusaceae bacterium]|nr:tetratricopeptide repeat protein [Sporomusaceae bacterium]